MDPKIKIGLLRRVIVDLNEKHEFELTVRSLQFQEEVEKLQRQLAELTAKKEKDEEEEKMTKLGAQPGVHGSEDNEKEAIKIDPKVGGALAANAEDPET